MAEREIDIDAILYTMVKFIVDHRISCPEAIHQNDEVIANAYDLIEHLCEIVGYYEYPDE
jgi:hypothetical protein